MLQLDDILAALKEASAAPPPPLSAPRPGWTPPPRRVVPPDPDDHPCDLTTLLAASDKLLAVSRGEAQPDNRDEPIFRKIHTPEQLLQERVDMDHGQVRQTAMRRLGRQRNLSKLPPGFFSAYADDLLKGNPLATPGEGLNPLEMTDQHRHITQVGLGGVDPTSISEGMQAVQPSNFGFIDAIAGPESNMAGVSVRAATGTRLGADGRIYQKLRDRRAGKDRWVSNADLADKVLALPD